MLKIIIFLGLVIFNNLQSEDHYRKAMECMRIGKYYNAIAIFNYLKYSSCYYDKSRAVLKLAQIYGGIFKNFPLRPQKEKAISFLEMILNPNSEYNDYHREEAQKLKDVILSS